LENVEVFFLGNQVYEVALVYVLAHLDAAEIGREVLERHPECTIGGVFRVV
jgi:hypothetical protein